MIARSIRNQKAKRRAVLDRGAPDSWRRSATTTCVASRLVSTGVPSLRLTAPADPLAGSLAAAFDAAAAFVAGLAGRWVPGLTAD